MAQYNIFQAIGMSFYSKKFYRDVAINWGGKTFLYVLVLLGLSWIFFTIQMQSFLTKTYAVISAKVINQIPVITIKNGKVSTPEARPYFIVDPETHKNLAVIDTTGKYKSLEQARAGILVTQTEVISQQKANEIRTDKIPTKLNYTLVPKVINAYLIEYLKFAWIPIFLLLLSLSYAYRIVQALIYSLFGKLVCVISSINLTYGQMIQITLVAITPAVVIATLLDYLNVSIAHELLYFCLLTLLYILYGINANRNVTRTART